MKNNKNQIAFYLPALLLFILSCNQKDNMKTQEPELNATEIKTDSLTKKAAETRSAYTAHLKAMDMLQLTAQLDKESARGLEPFNSLAYSEAVSRGKDFSGEILPLIKDSTRNSLLALLALNKTDADIYKTVDVNLRTSVLLDALANSKLYNAFGMPHTSWEFAAKVIISEGKTIRNGLTRLLADKKPAPVWGSEDHSEYMKYNYRVCDYALALINEIDGRKIQIPQSPEGRDKMISQIPIQNK